MASLRRRSPAFQLLATLISCFLAIAFLGHAHPARAANVIYVVPNGAGSASGADWANATTLQTALAQAGAGNQIWVQKGTYTPGTLRTDTFALKSGVAIYGGFGGGETALSQRDSSANLTALSGDIGTAGDPTDNSYNVVSGIGVDQDALLDGFAIVAGNAAHAQGAPFIGGGIYLDQANATIRNCTLHNNAADAGGGIAVRSGTPILSNLIIADNHATYGGGMILGGNAIVSFVTFRHNSADYGGGLEIEGANPQISEVLFSGNTASSYGGGMLTWQATPLIRQATFASNTAPHGGAIAIQESSLVIRNSIVWGNGSDPIYDYASSVVDVQYSIVEGIAAGLGNSNLDPLFVNAVGADGISGTADDDLHVQINSPAIDAGNNSDIPADLSDINGNGNTSEPIPIDLDGHARLTNGKVDMGVYEATPTQATVTTTPTTTPTDISTPTPTDVATPTPAKPSINYYVPLISRSGAE